MPKKLTSAQLVKIGKTFTPIQRRAIQQMRDRLDSEHREELSVEGRNNYTLGWNAGTKAWQTSVRSLLGWKD